jgi:formylglycine-generating enzyme required for sulfatase activity
MNKHSYKDYPTWLFGGLLSLFLIACGGGQQPGNQGPANGNGILTQLPKLIRKDQVTGEFVPATRKDAEMVLVPTGTFLMGTSKATSNRIATGYAMNFWDEMPQHKVNLRDFYIDKYEVTNEAYNKFYKDQGGTMPRFSDD